ncbi:AIR synthase-related protein [Klebsiella pneumoniae]|nr:AIR synthase-related protein [Klebsiella pneumoniae]
MRDVAQLKGFWNAMQALVAQRKLLAYHDRSDGGLLVTLAEMAFTYHCGMEADIAALGDDHLAALFNEELGAVIQVRAADREAVEAILAVNGLADCVHYLGKAVEGDRFVLTAAVRRCSAKAAPRCACGGRKPPGRCSVCATTRPAPIRSMRRKPMMPTRASM